MYREYQCGVMVVTLACLAVASCPLFRNAFPSQSVEQYRIAVPYHPHLMTDSKSILLEFLLFTVLWNLYFETVVIAVVLIIIV